MTIAIHVAAESGRVSLSRERVANVVSRVLRAERVRHALVSVTFLSPRAIATLNRKHLGHRGPTDVISFGFRSLPGAQAPVVGDIYIAPDVARTQAREFGVPVREELTRLLIHGTLHVLGYDHPEGKGRTDSRMWRRQERLLARMTGQRT